MALDSLFGFQLRKESIYGLKSLNKFGFNASVSTTEVTISDAGNDFDSLSSASVLKVSSSDATDASNNTGARTVQIQGVDNYYNEISEVVSLNGQTAVNTSSSFLRVFRAKVLTSGSNNKAAGDIYVGYGDVTSGIPDNILVKILANEGQTLMAIWTVPAGYTAYITNVHFSSGTEVTNHYITGRLKIKEIDSVYQTKQLGSFSTGSLEFNLGLPIKVPEKSDIKLTCKSSSGTQDCSGTFTLIYEKN